MTDREFWGEATPEVQLNPCLSLNFWDHRLAQLDRAVGANCDACCIPSQRQVDTRTDQGSRRGTRSKPYGTCGLLIENIPIVALD